MKKGGRTKAARPGHRPRQLLAAPPSSEVHGSHHYKSRSFRLLSSVYTRQFFVILVAIGCLSVCWMTVVGRHGGHGQWKFGRLISVVHTIVIAGMHANHTLPLLFLYPIAHPHEPAVAAVVGVIDAPRTSEASPLAQTQDALANHALRNYHGEPDLEDVMLYLKSQPSCKDLPIFVSMANVPSELYWQL
jgi:hypothetical protein